MCVPLIRHSSFCYPSPSSPINLYNPFISREILQSKVLSRKESLQFKDFNQKNSLVNSIMGAICGKYAISLPFEFFYRKLVYHRKHSDC